MKIAIVKGWEGVMRQRRIWNLEREVMKQCERIDNCEENLKRERVKLANLRAALLEEYKHG